jgi:hypothetical protein
MPSADEHFGQATCVSEGNHRVRQYATVMNFLIRFQARMAISLNMFTADLAPEQRTRVREEGVARARSGAAEMIGSAIGGVILGGGKPANARLVAAAIRDTREISASFSCRRIAPA